MCAASQEPSGRPHFRRDGGGPKAISSVDCGPPAHRAGSKHPSGCLVKIFSARTLSIRPRQVTEQRLFARPSASPTSEIVADSTSGTAGPARPEPGGVPGRPDPRPARLDRRPGRGRRFGREYVVLSPFTVRRL